MGSLLTTARQRAIFELLSRRDPIDAQRRHRHVLDGHADRHEQIVRLALTYIQSRLLEMREAESLHSMH